MNIIIPISAGIIVVGIIILIALGFSFEYLLYWLDKVIL